MITFNQIIESDQIESFIYHSDQTDHLSLSGDGEERQPALPGAVARPEVPVPRRLRVGRAERQLHARHWQRAKSVLRADDGALVQVKSDLS